MGDGASGRTGDGAKGRMGDGSSGRWGDRATGRVDDVENSCHSREGGNPVLNRCSARCGPKESFEQREFIPKEEAVRYDRASKHSLCALCESYVTMC